MDFIYYVGFAALLTGIGGVAVFFECFFQL
jgi:hypothetical protein